MSLRIHEPHLGHNRVGVGPYTVRAGGLEFLQGITTWPADVLVPLTDKSLGGCPGAAGKEIYALYLQDFGGVTPGWEKRLTEDIIPMLAAGREVMAFCYASHGRTGTFLASLIALLEPDTEDPIAAVRERHCGHAVEVKKQAEAIFALRGKALPDKYEFEFSHARQTTVK